MERLKSLIPNDLKRMIGESTTENLTSTCSSLLEFFRPLPQFQHVIKELTDPEMALCRKSKAAALDSKQKGNECFSKGDYVKALSYYSQALRYAPLNYDDIDVNLAATLYVNRASSMHKLGLLEECIHDCNRAIALSPGYVKAWYRRGKANASLKCYEVAIPDLEVAFSMEDTLPRKNHIKEELKMVLSKLNSTKGASISTNNNKNEKLAASAESYHIALQCVFIPSKGRGMTSADDIPPASLLHTEEPLAAIVMKSCRETHCHFCFSEVPADVLFCHSCTIPIYCSQHCQEQAGGQQFLRNEGSFTVQKCLSAELEKHVMNASLANQVSCAAADMNIKKNPEHRHECGGAHWSAVLPHDVVLAGRVMSKYIEKKSSGKISNPLETLEFAHNYCQIPLANKLELHIYATVLSYCLQNYYGSDFPSIGASVSQLVLLISQVKVNSMAVVHMNSLDGHEALKKPLKLSTIENAFTCNTEQARVGQAIYSTGSLFNHSCQPNIHAYFLARMLLIRSTEFVPAWNPLELSYGPQVGQLDLQGRQNLLEEQYSFKCQCSSCSELNLSDLIINAFRCSHPGCLGVVSHVAHYKKIEDDLLQVSGPSYSCKLSLPFSKHKMDISKVAHMLLKDKGVTCDIYPGYCLSCGFYRDLKSSVTASNSAMLNIQRLRDSLNSKEVPEISISDALESLSHLKLIWHPYSKVVAEAEDNIAEAYVRIGDFERAMNHCIASIEVPMHGHLIFKLSLFEKFCMRNSIISFIG
ncbi:uncharacterized protein LOC103724370 isoform X2 [Phoenix dactylifera]|uniref:Uncharacterized protein LOC103724370 isoform X2 n=1 Tax=Phoenix dactylifera TaxID=42345 RepID=A0A8B8IZ57_PHODC|nr:uncharacterized protein LOC103724370 isoform X2 [Phoenix dactylifera]